MTAKERQINERSLENLKLGAQARYQGKVRHNVSLLPETMEWLKKGGNASQRIDELVKAAKNGELKSDYTQNRKVEEQQSSNIVYNQIEQLEAEIRQLQSQVENLEGENNFQESRWKLTEKMNNGLAGECRLLKNELEQLRQERDRLASALAECQASQPQQLNYQAIRDRVLASLRLGKQAPEYKRTKKAIDSFIAFVQSL